MTKSVKQVLTDARALLADPRRWNQHSEAVDATGSPCHSLDNDAVRFCALGALFRAASPPRYGLSGLYAHAVDVLCRHLPGGPEYEYSMDLADFNDDEGTSHEDVLALYDRALEALDD